MRAGWFTAESLLARLASGRGPSVFDPPPWLVLEAEALPEPGTAESGALLQALPGIACPVIALAKPSADHPLLAACDLRVSDAARAEALVARIEAVPRAAATFVRLLRALEGLGLEAALTAESMAYGLLQAGPEYRQWLSAHRARQPRRASDAGPAVILEREGGAVALTLNRPSLQNSMTVEMRDALIEALRWIAADDQIETVTLRARGPCFSTGGELSEFGCVPDPVSGHLIRLLALPGRCLAALADRVTAHVHGACIGSGIEFPAFAGRVLARSDAGFQLPELGLGLIPGAGGCVSITRRIGRQRMTEWVLSGERIDAGTALAWGLVDAIE